MGERQYIAETEGEREWESIDIAGPFRRLQLVLSPLLSSDAWLYGTQTPNKEKDDYIRSSKWRGRSLCVCVNKSS